MDTFTVGTEAALLRALRKRRTPVPPRGSGRTKAHTEAWSRHTLLASLAGTKYLRYPLTVTTDDRPDLQLCMPRHNVGVEITELVSPAYAHAVTIRNREFPGAVLDSSLFPWGQQPMKTQEVRDLLRRTGHELTGPGWAGDDPEREWAAAVRDAAAVKTTKLNAPDYGSHRSYWLIIYNNLPLPAVDVRVAAKHLTSLLPPNPQVGRSFSHVFVESSRTLVCATRHGAVRLRPATPPYP